MEEPPAVLVLEGTYPWYRGGVSEWVHQYLKYTSKRPFNIIQIITEEYHHVPVPETLYNVPDHIQQFERVSPPPLTGQWKKDLYRWLKSVENQTRPLVEESGFVHIVNTGFAGWLGKELASLFDKPLVLTEHALYWKEIMMGAVALECGYKIPEEEKEKEAFSKMFRIMAEEIYSASNTVISVSKSNIPEQRKLGARDVHYIPNGIPADWLKQSSPERLSTLTIGWIGRCAEMKNPMKFFDVIGAFSVYDSSNVQFLMMICDADEPELEQRVKTRSRAYDRLKLVWNRSAREFIDQMDALCITSHNESQPLVIFEALSRKVLPIGWQTGDVTPEYGLILNPEATAGELATAVMEYWQNPTLWTRVLEKHFIKVKTDHTWEKIFANYHSLFSSMI